MRYINIDLSSDNHLEQMKIFGGYAGEHNETVLQVTLPQRMIGEYSDYRFDFQTSEDNKIPIPVSKLDNGVLSCHLTEQLTIAGKLSFNVIARKLNGNVVSLTSKTNMVSLYIGDSPDGNSVLPDPNGYKDEMLEIIDERIAEAIADIEIPEGDPINVDQIYNPDSENAQSGKAVAEAIASVGGNITVDHNFVDTSKNPQSGIAVAEAISVKQDTLIDGLNIKTINGESILGYGDLEISIPEGGSGENGATFTPNVSADGIISWTNDKGLANPSPMNIKGEQGIQGVQGEKGDKGDKGDPYTLTEEDKAEIIAEVITTIGVPIAGTIDENNVITLGGELAEGTYTLRWVNQNGYVEICSLTVDSSGEITPPVIEPDEPEEIKNWLNFGTTELGGTEIYNGKGWKENTRWSASGNAPADKAGMYLTGIIPVTSGDVVYTYGMPWKSSLSETAYMARYYSNGSIDEIDLTNPFNNGTLVPDDKGVYSFDVPADVVGVRFSCFGISDNSMITVNQYPIV